MKEALEFWGAVLSFAGGAVLTMETLLLKRRIREESGAKRLLEVMNRRGHAGVLKDQRGREISTERALQLWFAERTIRWGWAGFLLMAIGFLCEMAARW